MIAKDQDRSFPHPFVVLEGVDGVGKTTLARALARCFQGHLVSTPPEPFASIRNLVDEGADETSRFLFYLASVAWASVQIGRLLPEAPVFCDRWLWSTLSYHPGAAKEFGRHLGRMSIRRPDLALLLVADEASRLSRLNHRARSGEGKTSVAEYNSANAEAVQARFLSYPELRVVNTSRRSLSQVTDEVAALVATVLGSRAPSGDRASSAR